MKKYCNLELKIITEALNVLVKNSDKTQGVSMNVYHFSRFQSETHCIDYHEGLKKFKMYKHDKKYPSAKNEILSDNNTPTADEQMLDALLPIFKEFTKDQQKNKD